LRVCRDAEHAENGRRYDVLLHSSFFLGVVRVKRMPLDAARFRNRRHAFVERERGHPGFAKEFRKGRVLRDG